MTSFANSGVTIPGECADEIKRPVVTAIGAGYRASLTPLIVQDKVRGVDVVTWTGSSGH